MGVSLANCFEVVSSSLALTLWFGWPINLAKPRTLAGFLLTSVIAAAALTSIVGAWWTLRFYPGTPFWQMFRTWYLGDMLGMAILVPLLVTMQRPAFFNMFSHREILKTLVFLSVPIVATILVFTHNTDPLTFLIFPAFLLVAFRLGFPGTVVNILLVALLAIGFTVKGHGPLMLIPGDHMLLHRIVIAQIFAAVAIFTMFPVAALLEDKAVLKNSLAASEARFRDLAHSDELTGLRNRRAFNLQIESAWANAAQLSSSIALLLLDADLFKQYNDFYGHVSGDECLCRIAGVFGHAVEQTGGIAARFGGEEFAAILPHTSQEQALQIAEEIRSKVYALDLPLPSSPAGRQTVSIGVASLWPSEDDAPVELIRLADQALYTAKRNGRNRVAIVQEQATAS